MKISREEAREIVREIKNSTAFGMPTSTGFKLRLAKRLDMTLEQLLHSREDGQLGVPAVFVEEYRRACGR